MNMDKLRYLIPIFIAILCSTCDKSEIDRLNYPSDITMLDIRDAIYFGIDPAEFMFDTALTDGNNLIKYSSIGSDAIQKEVDFLDAAGFPVDAGYVYARANAIDVISEKYLILTGEFILNTREGETRSGGLLVNTESGRIHDLQSQFAPRHGNRYFGSSYFQKDQNGNAYFLRDGIRRLKFNDDEFIGLDYYCDYWDDFLVGVFFLDQYGNIVYNYGSKVRHSNGQTSELQTTRLITFNGFDGFTYGFQGEPGYHNILRYNFQDDIVTKEVLKPVDFRFDLTPSQIHYYPMDTAKKHFFFSSTQLNFLKQSAAEAYPIGIVYDENEGMDYRIYRSDPGSESLILGIEEDYLWCRESSATLGYYDIRDVIFDANDSIYILGNVHPVDITGDYNVTDFGFSESKVATFEGYEGNPLNRISGFVSVADSVFVIEQKYAGETIILSRIK